MIIKAAAEHIAIVTEITQNTIDRVYPHYYPDGAVDFFKAHHSIDSIAKDIADGCVYLIYESDVPAGTVTVRENHILRLFVAPEHQHKGYGRQLPDFAENKICESFKYSLLDSSLPAKDIYLKRGYRHREFHKIAVGKCDYLCYDVMERKL